MFKWRVYDGQLLKISHQCGWVQAWRIPWEPKSAMSGVIDEAFNSLEHSCSTSPR